MTHLASLHRLSISVTLLLPVFSSWELLRNFYQALNKLILPSLQLRLHFAESKLLLFTFTLNTQCSFVDLYSEKRIHYLVLYAMCHTRFYIFSPFYSLVFWPIFNFFTSLPAIFFYAFLWYFSYINLSLFFNLESPSFLSCLDRCCNTWHEEIRKIYRLSLLQKKL